MSNVEPATSNLVVGLADQKNIRVISSPVDEYPPTAFPRTARLLTGGDFSLVFKKNKRYSDRYFTVLVRHCENSTARLGLAIAKKRAKRAVDRNRVKRIAREAFRHNRLRLYGHELVVMNRDAAAKADPRMLRESMDKLLQKIVNSAG